MRTVSELNQNELEELRGNYYHQLLDTDEEVLENISCEEDIPMSNIIAHYEEIFFEVEDFFCNL